MPTFIQLTALRKIHYHAKLHENLTISFHVIGNFLKVKGQHQTLSKSNHLQGGQHNTYSYQVTSINGQQLFSFCTGQTKLKKISASLAWLVHT